MSLGLGPLIQAKYLLQSLQAYKSHNFGISLSDRCSDIHILLSYLVFHGFSVFSASDNYLTRTWFRVLTKNILLSFQFIWFSTIIRDNSTSFALYEIYLASGHNQTQKRFVRNKAHVVTHETRQTICHCGRFLSS